MSGDVFNEHEITKTRFNLIKPIFDKENDLIGMPIIKTWTMNQLIPLHQLTDDELLKIAKLKNSRIERIEEQGTIIIRFFDKKNGNLRRQLNYSFIF